MTIRLKRAKSQSAPDDFDERERLCSEGLAVERDGELLLTRRGRRELALRLVERASRPRWDAGQFALLWRGRVVKRLRREARAQEAILSSFEAQGWPGRIDDPLGEDSEKNPMQRLRDTVKNLNRNLARGTVRFRTDGRGRGVCWESASSP